MDRGTLPAIAIVLVAGSVEAAADDAAEAKLFKNHCGACHTIEASAPPRQGPNLHGVLGRKAGSLAGFKYSAGLKAAGWLWTPEQLDLWLTDPKAMAPDTLMSVYRQKDPEKRKQIINFLAANGGS
jgi:cytochrome c